MTQLYFNARFIPQNSTQLDSTSWQVQADIFDGNGFFSGSDVAVNDAVFLDCFNSISFPGTINRYKVTQINSVNGFHVNVNLLWDDGSDIVPVDEVLGSQGFICRVTDNKGLPFHAAPTLHLFADYVVQYARNSDSFKVLDPYGNKYVKNGSGGTIGKYKVVAWNDDGTVSKANARQHTFSDVAGLTLQSSNTGDFVWIIKRGYVPGALTLLNPLPGDRILLDPDNPGELTLTEITDLTTSIILIGRAEPPSGIASSNAVDLDMEMIIEQEI